MRYWFAVLMAVVAWGQEPGTATVHGRVVIQVTQEPVGATISIDGLAARAGDDGRYRLTSIPSGHHVLRAQSPGFRYLDIEVELKAGDVVELPVAELRLANMCGGPDEPRAKMRWLRNETRAGVLRGTVTGERGRALEGAGVTLTDGQGQMARKVTDKTGRFEFELKPGQYGMRLDRAGYWPVSFHTSVVAGLETDFGEQRMVACEDGVCREPRKVEPGRCE